MKSIPAALSWECWARVRFYMIMWLCYWACFISLIYYSVNATTSDLSASNLDTVLHVMCYLIFVVVTILIATEATGARTHRLTLPVSTSTM